MPNINVRLQKGGVPAAPSGTATLLRLRPSYRPRLGRLPPLRVSSPTSGVANFHDVTGGVYNPRERIHRTMADARLLATPPSWGRVAAPNLHWAGGWRFAAPRGVAAHCHRHCSVCVAPGVRAMRT